MTRQETGCVLYNKVFLCTSGMVESFYVGSVETPISNFVHS